MATHSKDRGRLLYDDDDRLVAVTQPGGVEDYFALVRVGAAAPVDGVKATLTTDMTNANADITLTAADYGIEGNTISIVYVDPGAASQSLSVWVSGSTLIHVSLATNAGSAITSTANAVKTALDANAYVAALVAVTVEGTGLGVVNAKAEAALTGGVTCTLGASPAGEYYSTDTAEYYVKLTDQVWTPKSSYNHVISYTAITEDYTVLVTDSFIDIDASSNTVTATLPSVSDVPTGRVFRFKASDVTNTITIEGDGAETIDGAANITMPGANSVRQVVSTGTAWKVW